VLRSQGPGGERLRLRERQQRDGGWQGEGIGDTGVVRREVRLHAGGAQSRPGARAAREMGLRHPILISIIGTRELASRSHGAFLDRLRESKLGRRRQVESNCRRLALLGHIPSRLNQVLSDRPSGCPSTPTRPMNDQKLEIGNLGCGLRAKSRLWAARGGMALWLGAGSAADVPG
jgi:hypothetical protein